MEKTIIERINELNSQISKLPKGYISTKTIGGNIYYYHQWQENNKKYSKYLSEEELLKLDALIKQRQLLEQDLKALKKGSSLSYTLMHLNEKVVDLFFDDNGRIKSIGSIYSVNHLPVGVVDEKGNINNINLIEWWNDRSIPLSRSGIREVIEQLEISTPQFLLLKCFGLSLSDQYWIKPKEEDLKWEDVNFFHNEFSDDVGELLLGGEIKNKDLNLSSPDNTSVGNLKKRWKIVNNQRVLLKGGSNPFRQEPFNEVVASKIANELGIPVVNYSLRYVDGYPYSECADFIKDDEELVTAYQINKVLKKSNNDSNYAHLVKCANKLGIKDFEDYLNKLIVFDFIIANEDRHFNNFGIIRNAKTLDIVGPAPIYDSGSSFGFDKLDADIKEFKDIEAKPFKKDIVEQLDLVTSFAWLDIKRLIDMKTKVLGWFKELESKYLSQERITAISTSTAIRIDYLLNKLADRK